MVGTGIALCISEADAEKEAAQNGVIRCSQPACLDLDTMKEFGDYRKPRDRVVPIYHAMLSKGGRAMHRFLGFLSMVILFIEMVNSCTCKYGS